MWQNVTNVFPKGSSLANYIIYGLYSRKNLSQGKNYLYAKMSFNKIVKLWLKNAGVGNKYFTDHFGVYSRWSARGYRSIVSLNYKIISKGNSQTRIEGAGFSLLKNMEVQEAIQFGSILHLPMNTYKIMQRIMTHISLGTFVTEKNALKYFKRQVTASFSYVCERFEAVY